MSSSDNKELREIRNLFIIFFVGLGIFFVIFLNWNFIKSYFNDVYTTFFVGFVATFFGVLFAFNLDRVVDFQKSDRDKKDLKRLLHNELEYLKSRIYPQEKNSVYMLYPDIWDFAVSSGQLRLLDSEQVIKIVNVYRSVKGTSYEASRIRDAIEEFNNTHPVFTDQKQFLESRYKAMWQRHNQRMEDLTNDIEKLLKENWWEDQKKKV